MYLLDDNQLAFPLWVDMPDALEVLEAKTREGEISNEEAIIINDVICQGFGVFDVGNIDNEIDNINSSYPLLWKLQPTDLLLAGHARTGRPFPFSILANELRREPGVRILDMHSHVPGALSLYLNTKAHRICSLIFGAQAVATQSLYFEYGSTQSLHRDPWYVNHSPRTHLLAIWFALEDIHPDSGPLTYVPGSHRLPYYRFSTDDVVFHDSRLSEQERSAGFKHMRQSIMDMPEKHLLAKKGQAFIWHHSLVHGGADVKDPSRTRNSFVVHYGRVDTHDRRGVGANTDDGLKFFFTEKRYISPEGTVGFYNPAAGELGGSPPVSATSDSSFDSVPPQEQIDGTTAPEAPAVPSAAGEHVEDPRLGELHAAAATWNDPNESLEDVNARIHDGVPLDQLEARASRYVREILGHFPYLHVPSNGRCLEIGSGTGFIMEALAQTLIDRGVTPQAIIGLDIAEHMLARARQRLGSQSPFEFLHYDGITVPLPDQSLDLIYSVASLQHVPKPYVHNLFFEIHRLLSPTGFAVLHLLSYDQMVRRQNYAPWRREVARQIRNAPGMWVHFYTQEELNAVLSTGTGFAHVDTLQLPNGIWSCVAHKVLTADGENPEFA